MWPSSIFKPNWFYSCPIKNCIKEFYEIIKNLQYCQQNKGLEIYAYVITPFIKEHLVQCKELS